MPKTDTFHILIIFFALSITACQANPKVDLTAVPPVLASAANPSIPPTALPPAVSTPIITPLPAPTRSPLPPPAAPACFVSLAAPAAFLPDNFHILLRAPKEVQIFNLQSLQVEKRFPAPSNLSYALALSPDGKTLAWALENNAIQLLRLWDGRLLATLKGHTAAVTRLKFSPGGDRLYSASHDTWVRVWDLKGNQLRAFQPAGADNLPSPVLGLGLSPDASRLVTIPMDGPVSISSLENDRLVNTWGGSGGNDTSDITFSPDGQFAAANLAAGLFLWKTADGTQVLPGETRVINSLAAAYSPDGSFLAYSDIGEKDSIVLASPDGTRKLRTLEGHQAPVWALLFSPDSSLLASADGLEMRIWRVADGQWLFVAKSECP